MPFAGIIGMICDHPCEKACVRDKLDQSISISELERASVCYGYTPLKKGITVPKKNGKVAVIGGGLSGITAAYDLNIKGFEVTVYEKSDKLGGQIWIYEDKLIKKEKIEEELKIVDQLGIHINYNHKVEEDELERIISEYDAVYLGTGKWEKGLAIDPDTFQVLGSKIFAAGKLYNKTDSVIYAVSSGKRAAVSMERFIKKVSMSASRNREGSFETPLKYNLEDVKPPPRIEKTHEICTEEEAIA